MVSQITQITNMYKIQKVVKLPFVIELREIKPVSSNRI